ncbi:rCG46157, isoform CRA_b [Rattus norvegicus]|uniref:RCG46157, isoform CRA_b n=1 Tax=Rattus norvegicus TaxID=10116 RepID=A6IDF7_RAT|nr:rCG46157, isoform CRA_b [Rattus norvegicus]
MNDKHYKEPAFLQMNVISVKSLQRLLAGNVPASFLLPGLSSEAVW